MTSKTSHNYGLPRECVEIIKDKLYFYLASTEQVPAEARSHFKVFTKDTSIIYTAFFADYGPIELGLTYKFCKQLTAAMESNRSQSPLLFCAGDCKQDQANAAVLLLAYLIWVLDYTVEDAYAPFIYYNQHISAMASQRHNTTTTTTTAQLLTFTTYRDAGFCLNTFPITVLDCARAMFKARSLGHFKYNSFHLPTHQHLQQLQNGDISWIIPDKFIAFSGPINVRRKLSDDVYTLLPEDYVPIFKQLNVTCVVRFNDKCYDKRVFTSNGIRHVDLYYDDGGNPSDQILQAFLTLCEQERGAIAVHCKAGLGRTGTNICAYMVKHYGYTAREAIAWARICRPGSVVGPQQQYMSAMEQRLKDEGEQYRLKHKTSLPRCLPLSSTSGDTSHDSQSHSSTPPTGINSNNSSKSNSTNNTNTSNNTSGTSTREPLLRVVPLPLPTTNNNNSTSPMRGPHLDQITTTSNNNSSRQPITRETSKNQLQQHNRDFTTPHRNTFSAANSNSAGADSVAAVNRRTTLSAIVNASNSNSNSGVNRVSTGLEALTISSSNSPSRQQQSQSQSQSGSSSSRKNSTTASPYLTSHTPPPIDINNSATSPSRPRSSSYNHSTSSKLKALNNSNNANGSNNGISVVSPVRRPMLQT